MVMEAGTASMVTRAEEAEVAVNGCGGRGVVVWRCWRWVVDEIGGRGDDGNGAGGGWGEGEVLAMVVALMVAKTAAVSAVAAEAASEVAAAVAVAVAVGAVQGVDRWCGGEAATAEVATAARGWCWWWHWCGRWWGWRRRKRRWWMRVVEEPNGGGKWCAHTPCCPKHPL